MGNRSFSLIYYVDEQTLQVLAGSPAVKLPACLIYYVDEQTLQVALFPLPSLRPVRLIYYVDEQTLQVAKPTCTTTLGNVSSTTSMSRRCKTGAVLDISAIDRVSSTTSMSRRCKSLQPHRVKMRSWGLIYYVDEQTLQVPLWRRATMTNSRSHLRR